MSISAVTVAIGGWAHADRALAVVTIVSALAIATPALSQEAVRSKPHIVEAARDPRPTYSGERNPTVLQLIETWRAGNEFMPGKRVDVGQRFEIVDQRVAWGIQGRAVLQFRLLPKAGDAIDWARARCPGRNRAVEIQVYFQYSNELNAWVPQSARGEGSEDLCAGGKLWTADQIKRLVDPPPLPTPPIVLRHDIYTPERGSSERAAIMNALRPRYEELFGKPVIFSVKTLRVVAGFAYVVVHPQRPNGSPIEQKVWAAALGKDCFQDRLGVRHEYWLKREAAVWTIGVKNDMCADDSIVDQGDLIGAPPQLAGKEKWPVREFLPDPDLEPQ